MSTSTAFVLSLNGGRGKWSRYSFPFAIEAFAQLGNDLYIRYGDRVVRVSEDAVTDDVDGVATNFSGLVQWPWLDFGQPGVTKRMIGFDLVAEGLPSVSIGYDQRDTAVFTAPYQVPADNLYDGIIPFEISAPTLAVKLTFAGGQRWSVNEVNVYLNDTRPGT